MANLSVRLPLDDDGFLRRHCERCGRDFKWHHGTTDVRPDDAVDPDEYTCPLCGVRSDSWNTEDQQRLITEIATRWAAGQISDMLADAFRGNSNITFKPGPTAPAPKALLDDNDMCIIESPCHPWEPVKVPEYEAGPFYCLVCGAMFNV